MIKKPKYSEYNKGFTLIELSIVIAIVSVLITGYFALTVNLSVDQKISQNNLKLDKIERAIEEFYIKNGYIPCPASRADEIHSATFGVSVPTCTAVAAGTSDIGSGVDQLKAGVVPVRTLGLPDDSMFDGWDNRISYTMVSYLGIDADTFLSNETAIDPIVINDASGNSMTSNITEPNHIAYVLVSHGPNAKGAYNYFNGTQGDVTTGLLDDENWDNDNTFIYSTYIPNSYDDFMRWGTRQQLKFKGFVANGQIGQGAENFSKIAIFMHKEGGDVGIASTGWQVRFLNHTLVNNLNQASLASNVITLGPGTYYMRASAVGCQIAGHTLRIFNDTDNVVAGRGTAAYSDPTTEDCNSSEAFAYIKIPYKKDFVLQSYVTVANPTTGFGKDPLSGPDYEHVKIEIWEL